MTSIQPLWSLSTSTRRMLAYGCCARTPLRTAYLNAPALSAMLGWLPRLRAWTKGVETCKRPESTGSALLLVLIQHSLDW